MAMTGDRRRVVALGFDAMSPAIVRELVDAGRLPTFAALFDSAAWAPTENPWGLLVGGVWPSFATGTTPARHGFYCFRQIVDRSYTMRRFTPDDIRTPAVWQVLSDAGLRSTVIDAPLATATPGLRGRQLVEWGAHDRMVAFDSVPADFGAAVMDRAGEYPVHRCDDFARAGDFVGLREALRAGIAAKHGLMREQLADPDWDFFFGVHSESHCAGHQFWQIHDVDHQWHDPGLRATIGDPLVDIYEALDGSLAQLLTAVPDDTTVMVLLSHGIGPHYDGDHLLFEVLARLDDSLRPRPQWLVRREQLLRRIGRPRQRRLGRVWVDGSRSFYKMPNNELYGGIRLNVVGREPRGRVRRGAEFDALADELRSALLELVDPDTGRPLVRDVVRTDARYEGDAIDLLPDLLIDWHRDAPMNAAASPRIGVVRYEYGGPRSGDHRPDGLVFVTGDGIEPGPLDTPVGVIDLAPSLAAALGVEMPDVDGVPVPAFVGAQTSTR
jgi:predicted AlkP superfamily phosphohydrolase/phosphomutase